MSDLTVIKQVDLADFLWRHYDVRIGPNGAALCPFHDDHEPSLSVSQKNGVGLFKCHGCGAAGTIIDFVKKKEGFGFMEAVRRIQELEGIREEAPPGPKVRLKTVRVHSYTDENGTTIWQKIKRSDGSFLCCHKEGDKWIYDIKGIRRVPYRLDKIKDAPDVIICEGERDADTLAALGYPATTGPNGKDSWPDEITPMFAGKTIRIIYDVGNDKAALNVARKLSAVCKNIFILKVPLPEHEADITDYLSRFATDNEKRDAFLGIGAAEERFCPAGFSNGKTPTEKRGDAFDIVEMVGLDMVPIDWLWYPVAPIGMVGTVLGTPGVGKSYMLTDLAARVSRGEELPLYRKQTEKVAHGWVIFITSEGVPDKILKPRLYAAGADMKNITVIKGRVTKDGDFVLLDIRFHLNELRDLIKNDPRTCVLVIIDPLASFVSGNANLNDMTQTRQALDTVARFAEATTVAVMVAIHPNKNESQQLQNRAAGSVQMSAAVKTCWVVVEPKDDDPINMRYFSPYKIATAPCNKKETLPFYMDNADFTHNGRLFEMAKIRWSPEIVGCDIELILCPRSGDGVNFAAKARALLKEQLKEGPKKVIDLFRMAKELGINTATMYKAKDFLNIDDAPTGFQGTHLWIPPTAWPKK